jgi:hypothetical protein
VAQRPVAVSLLLCEQIIIEAGTRNCPPVNCFSRRYVEQVPSEPISFAVLAYLADGIGEMQLELFIERLDTMEEIYRDVYPIRFTGPLQEIRAQLFVRHLSFPVVGDYQVQLVALGDVVAQKKLRIVERRRKT